MSKSNLEYAKEFKQKGNNYFKLGLYQKAIQCYSLSIETYPLVESFSNRSNANMRLQRYQQALKDCERGIEIDNKNVKCLRRKGQCLIQLMRIDQAIALQKFASNTSNGQLIQQVIDAANYVKSCIQKYKEFRNKNDFIRAQSSLEEIYPKIVNNIQIKISMIQCKSKTNKNQALTELKSVEKDIDQTSFVYWYLRAIIQLEHGVRNRAKRYLKQSIRYFTTKALKQIEKSLIIDFTSQKLIQLLENITTLEPLIAEVYSIAKSKKSKEAIRKLIIILDMEGLSNIQRTKLLYLRAQCYKQTKQKPKQLQDLNTIIRMNPNYTEGLQARILFYESEKNFELALKDAQKLNKITSKHSNIVQRITRKLNARPRQKIDYYELLGIRNNATVEEINKSYKELAIIYHPDKNRGLNQQEQQFAKNKFKEIKKAQVCLIDAQKKAFYDLNKCEIDQMEQGSSFSRSGFDLFNIFRSSSSFSFDPNFANFNSFGEPSRNNNGSFFFPFTSNNPFFF